MMYLLPFLSVLPLISSIQLVTISPSPFQSVTISPSQFQSVTMSPSPFRYIRLVKVECLVFNDAVLDFFNLYQYEYYSGFLFESQADRMTQCTLQCVAISSCITVLYNKQQRRCMFYDRIILDGTEGSGSGPSNDGDGGWHVYEGKEGLDSSFIAREPKTQIHYCDHALSVVRRSVVINF